MFWSFEDKKWTEGERFFGDGGFGPVWADQQAPPPRGQGKRGPRRKENADWASRRKESTAFADPGQAIPAQDFDFFLLKRRGKKKENRKKQKQTRQIEGGGKTTGARLPWPGGIPRQEARCFRGNIWRKWVAPWHPPNKPLPKTDLPLYPHTTHPGDNFHVRSPLEMYPSIAPVSGPGCPRALFVSPLVLSGGHPPPHRVALPTVPAGPMKPETNPRPPGHSRAPPRQFPAISGIPRRNPKRT